MTEYHYPWLKMQKDTRNDPKIRKLSLAEQAVFYNLLQYAGEQDEEGAFDDSDREELALEVAADQQDVLDAALTQLLRYKVVARLDDGRLAFVNYEKHQASSKDSNAARQRRFYQRHHAGAPSVDDATLTAPNGHRQDHNASITTSNGLLTTPDGPLQNKRRGDKRREEVGGRGESEGDMEHPLTGPTPGPTSDLVTEAEEILGLLVKLGCVRSTQNLAAVRLVVQKLPSVAALEVALDHYRWQEPMPKKDRLKDQIHGWQKAMQRAYEGSKYQRTPTPPPRQGLKERPPPTGEEREVLRRRAAAQEARAAALEARADARA